MFHSILSTLLVWNCTASPIPQTSIQTDLNSRKVWTRIDFLGASINDKGPICFWIPIASLSDWLPLLNKLISLLEIVI